MERNKFSQFLKMSEILRHTLNYISESIELVNPKQSK